MSSKNQIEMRYIILIGLGLAAIMLGIITNAVNDKRPLNPVEKAIKDSVLLVNKIIYTPVVWLNDQLNDAKEKQDLYLKYQKLQTQVAEIELTKVKQIELENEIIKMQELLDLNMTLTKYTYLNATVLNRNLGFWYNTLTLDKGSSNGVKVDMAVITSQGLVGKIIKTTNFSSTVRLLTTEDINSKISIKIQVGEKAVYGLLTGYNQKNNTFIIEGIADNIDLPNDSLVMTTGLGGLFPSGILVGYVTSFKTDNFDLAKIVEVKSKVNFNDISYVTILKRSDQ